jgi:CRP/FNR family transcriptional regulator, cyclic AMP receptor protein
LVGVPDILAGLSAAQTDHVVSAGHRVGFAAGDMLFRQGEVHRGIFILRSGVVRSFYQAPGGREITLAHWTRGNFVGGPEIFGGGVHVWSGIGVETGAALRLPGPTIRRLMTEIPAFAIGLVEGLAFKGKCYTALLQMLGTRSVVERLAQLLLNLEASRSSSAASPAVAQLPTHEQLATMIGATRQWVSMTLERFRAQGIIDTRGRRIVIQEPAALRALAHTGRFPLRSIAGHRGKSRGSG